jgi:hypothetical protein
VERVVVTKTAKDEENFMAVAAATTITVTSASDSEECPAPKGIDKDAMPEYYREKLLEEFADVLVDKLPNELPPLREVNHRVPYNPSTPYVAHKYRLPEDRKEALEKDIEAKQESGILAYPSNVPLAASYMVPKHEPGKYRHVQDLRKGNENTESRAWPMPDHEELTNNVAQSSNLLVADQISAFDQTRVEPEDEKFTAIINHKGVFVQWTIQQGDKNAVATQQRTMQHNLESVWGKNVTVYVDDFSLYDEKPGMSAYSHYLVCRKTLLSEVVRTGENGAKK